MTNNQTYIEIAEVADRMDRVRPVVGDGPVVMLNLLRFKTVADYSNFPALAPKSPITGEEAYMRYLSAVKPRMLARGGDIVFLGKSDSLLIGPADERWDMVLLARWPKLAGGQPVRSRIPGPRWPSNSGIGRFPSTANVAASDLKPACATAGDKAPWPLEHLTHSSAFQSDRTLAALSDASGSQIPSDPRLRSRPKFSEISVARHWEFMVTIDTR